MTPSERDMPIIEARLTDGRWVVKLPDGSERRCSDEWDVRRTVAREATGAAVRFVIPFNSEPARDNR